MQKKDRIRPAAESTANLQYSVWIDIVIAFLFLTVCLIGIFHHEMWRDEYQSWMVAKDSHSLFELYSNARFEGHPFLWYIILYLITSFTHSFFAVQLFNVFAGTTFVFLFNRYSGFRIVERILFTFGYYAAFEFTLITRSYNLELLLLSISIILSRRLPKNYFILSMVLFLLANVSAFGLVFSLCVILVVIIENFQELKGFTLKSPHFSWIVAGTFFVLSGIVISAIQIRPEHGNLVTTDVHSLLEIERMKVVFSRIYDAFFLIPEWRLLPYWNFAGTLRMDSLNVSLECIISVFILLLCVVTIYRKPLVLFFFCTAMIGTFVLCELPFIIAVRYTGRFFIAFLFSIWLSHHVKEHLYQGKFSAFISRTGAKLEHYFLITIFVSQFSIGVAYYFTDLKMPFSSSAMLVEKIIEQHLDSLPILGSQDYAVSAISAILNKPIFYPESKSFGTFITWDNSLRKNQNPDFGVIIESIDSVLSKNHHQALIILNSLPAGPNGKLEHDYVTSDIHMDLIFQSDKCMVPDEYYYVYKATRTVFKN